MLEKSFNEARDKQEEYNRFKKEKRDVAAKAAGAVKEKERKGRKDAMEVKMKAFNDFTK